MGASTSNRITIDPQGRIVIPAEVRKARGWKPGDRMVVVEIDGLLTILTAEEAGRRAQEIVMRYVPAGVSLVDELLKERREAAARGD
ncbi:MAG: AbrB/MazE/SpoVT family DNA-binding domain-containing protein [Chloroflexi bacterium]|nr:AbrB/MazE/SpoVT family DNA-binding domain-containing protein [Chloroflexota bacterium]MDA1240845.1 AbrB/MazE/SpoVT family DNA-binding domain-containing protein [Chloroflexota bacterium]